MSADQALLRLGRSAAEAVADVLRGFVPDGVEVGASEVVAPGAAPLEGVPVPAVAAEVQFVGGVTGGSVFVTTLNGVRALGAAMTGSEPPPGARALSEREVAAVAEAMRRMAEAAAGATGALIGQEVAISTPEVRELDAVPQLLEIGRGDLHAVRVRLTLGGESCALVQLVPKAFVVRMTRALDELAATVAGTGERTAGDEATRAEPDDILRTVPLRVCAEIGRSPMPLARAVSLPVGGVVELDRGAEDPVDLYVNGRRFATGRLVLVEDEWAVVLEDVFLDAADLDQAASAV